MRLGWFYVKTHQDDDINRASYLCDTGLICELIEHLDSLQHCSSEDIMREGLRVRVRKLEGIMNQSESTSSE